MKYNTDSLYDAVIDIYQKAKTGEIMDITLVVQKAVNIQLLTAFLSLLDEISEEFKVEIELKVIDYAGVF